MAISKNNRKLKPASGPYNEVGDSTRIVPLGAGFCYMRDPRGPITHHIKVGSVEFIKILDEFSAILGKDKLLAELDTLARRYPDTPWTVGANHLRSNS